MPKISTYLYKSNYNIPWLRANQIVVRYPVNGMFLCLRDGCSSFSTPFKSALNMIFIAVFIHWLNARSGLDSAVSNSA